MHAINYVQYGLRRTGTNWFEQLFKKNFDKRFSNNKHDRKSLLHKHSILHDYTDFSEFDKRVKHTLQISHLNIYFIHIKHPYSWWLSMKKWNIKCNTHCEIKDACQRYNCFYNKWLRFYSFAPHHITFVKYENLLKDWGETLNTICRKHQIKPKDELQNVTHVPQSSKFDEQRKMYYLNDGYLKDITCNEKKIIASIIDQNILNFFQYDVQ